MWVWGRGPRLYYATHTERAHVSIRWKKEKKEKKAAAHNTLIMAAPPPPPPRCGEKRKCGYDCDFVNPPPDAFQTECPVCLQILREPCVISCTCGQKMCRECVEAVKENKKPCPLCNVTDFTYIRDYGFERGLKELQVRCSNENRGCQWRGKLSEYEEHLNKKPSSERYLIGCQHVCLECPLRYAGCQVTMPRNIMSEHLRDMTKHFPLLVSMTQNLSKENEVLKQDNKELKHSLQYLKEEMKNKIGKLEEKTNELQLTVGGFPIDFPIKYPNEEECIFLPSFYSHSHGYRMCLRVYPNGYCDGKITHGSIYTCLMKGLYDDHLKWPFRGDVTIQIVNQLGDHNHVEETTHFHNSTSDVSAGRVTDKERSGGLGSNNVHALKDLAHNPATNTQYLKDGIIIVRVVQVKVN